MTPAPVRLRPAYSWECRCGAKNWEEALPGSYPFTGEMLKFFGLGSLEAKWAPVPPGVVRCRSCGEAFAAEGG